VAANIAPVVTGILEVMTKTLAVPSATTPAVESNIPGEPSTAPAEGIPVDATASDDPDEVDLADECEEVMKQKNDEALLNVIASISLSTAIEQMWAHGHWYVHWNNGVGWTLI